MTSSSVATGTAAEVVVTAVSRVADFAPQLRAVAAIRRARLLRQGPLVAELEGALADRELRLHYQPMYDDLQRLGCSVIQGYLLHRPAPPETITEALRREPTDASRTT